MGLLEEITDVERRLAGADPAAYREVCREDAVFLMPGMVVGLDEALTGLTQAGPWDEFALSDAQVRRLGPEASVLLYRFTGRRGEMSYVADMASSYAREEGRWRLVTHQQTPVLP